MGLTRWVRSTSEHYLMIDAEDKVGSRLGMRRPLPPQGHRDLLAPHLRAALSPPAAKAAGLGHRPHAGQPPKGVEEAAAIPRACGLTSAGSHG